MCWILSFSVYYHLTSISGSLSPLWEEIRTGAEDTVHRLAERCKQLGGSFKLGSGRGVFFLIYFFIYIYLNIIRKGSCWKVGLMVWVRSIWYANMHSVSLSLSLKPEQRANSSVNFLFHCDLQPVQVDWQVRVHLYSALKHCCTVFGNREVNILACSFPFFSNLSHYHTANCSVTLILFIVCGCDWHHVVFWERVRGHFVGHGNVMLPWLQTLLRELMS